MRIELVKGDITAVAVDVIVNAANSSLSGGGGVDGAIHRASGESLAAECRAVIAERGPLVPGQIVRTGAGALPARAVFHALGPVWRGGRNGEREQLSACYENALSLARELGFASIAFPAISTGAYLFPKNEAVALVRRVIDRHLAALSPLHVLFVNPDPENHRLYQAAFAGMTG